MGTMDSQIRLQGERYRWPVSDKELNRRLTSFQNILKKLEIDCAISQSQSTVLDGVIRYFVDQTTGLYSSSLMIPSEGDMTYLCHGNDNDNAPIPDSIRNVGKLIFKPYCQMFDFTDKMEAETMAKEIKSHGYKRIGLLCPKLMSYDYVAGMKNLLPDVEFIDVSREFYELRSVKSEEEWKLIDKSMEVHDRLMYMVPAILKPGIMEYELRSELARACVNLGCDSAAFIAVGSGEQGQRAQYTAHFASNRRINSGDNVCVMIEICGPGGIYGELARTFCLGEPGDSIIKLFDIAKGCQKAIAEAAKPDVTGAEVNKVFDEYVGRYGIGPNMRFAGHGMGYDMMEAPAINANETMKFQENGYVALHPELVIGNEFVTCSDNFRITKEGAKRLSKVPQEIICL